MPETSSKKVRQSELMIRGEFNPHIKQQRKYSYGGPRSELGMYNNSQEHVMNDDLAEVQPRSLPYVQSLPTH